MAGPTQAGDSQVIVVPELKSLEGSGAVTTVAWDMHRGSRYSHSTPSEPIESIERIALFLLISEVVQGREAVIGRTNEGGSTILIRKALGLEVTDYFVLTEKYLQARVPAKGESDIAYYNSPRPPSELVPLKDSDVSALVSELKENGVQPFTLPAQDSTDPLDRQVLALTRVGGIFSRQAREAGDA